MQPPGESDLEIMIRRSELKLTCSFVAEVTATFKAVRHFLRANPAVRAQGCPYPEYSPQFERMIAFVQREAVKRIEAAHDERRGVWTRSGQSG